MALAVVISAFIFCLLNGLMQGYAIGNTIEAFEIQQMSSVQVLGLLLFIAGFLANQHADQQLRKLRKNSSVDYQIPHGGLLEYCSAGNYSGELLEWLGYLLVSRFSLASTAFLVYSAANLIPRGKAYHQFYKDKFKDYPKDRTAVIPFIY